MKKVLMLTIVLLAVFLTACSTVRGNGNVISESYDLATFSEITLSGTGTATVTIGDVQQVTVTTDSNVFDALDISVQNGTLNLGTKNNTMIADYTELTYDITVTELDAARLSGSGNMTIESLAASDFSLTVSGSGSMTLDGIDADTLDVALSGSGDIRISDVTVETLDARVSGSGRIRVEGNADTADLQVTGSGDFEGFDLAISTADMRVSGSGDIEINASDSISGTISGSGNLTHRGDADIDVNVTGSGDVRTG